MEKCTKCDRDFKNSHALRVHNARSHSRRARARKAAKARWAKAKAEKTVRAPRRGGAMPIIIRYCPHCGSEIPNAIIRG